jgi:hypothetical protein
MNRPESPFSAVKSPTTTSIRGQSLCYNRSAPVVSHSPVLLFSGAHRFSESRKTSARQAFLIGAVSRRRNSSDPRADRRCADTRGTGRQQVAANVNRGAGRGFWGHCAKYRSCGPRQRVAEGDCEL